MQTDDKNLIKLLEALNKFSVCAVQLINNLVKQNILPMEQFLNKLPPKVRAKWEKMIKNNTKVKSNQARSR